MRSLLVAHDVPWPSLGGGRVRLARMVDALSAVTDLDLFVLHDPGRSTLALPADVAVQRSTSVEYPRPSSRIRWRLDWAAHRGVPLEVIGARADHGPRRALREWSRPPYDVVWFSTASAYEWMGRPDLGPTIVDLDNLEDVKARLRAELMADEMRSSGASLSLRSRVARYQVRLNGSDWRRFQQSVAGQVERVVFASELDATRSGMSNVTVIPNTYPRPRRPAGSTAVGGAPVLVFQGDLEYPPNIDAARWLATGIAPLVREEVPATEVRLVGRPGTTVRHLDDPGRLTVVGEVPAMEVELAQASVAVVPLRYGSGTRVKILESFAHRVPVVSTTLGAEGLDVEDGVHLLLADGTDAFAAATVRLLRDVPLRLRLTEAAEARYVDRYDGRLVDRDVRALVENVAASRTRS